MLFLRDCQSYSLLDWMHRTRYSIRFEEHWHWLTLWTLVVSLVDLNDNEPKFEKLVLYLSDNASMSLGASSAPGEKYLPAALTEALPVNTSILEVQLVVQCNLHYSHTRNIYLMYVKYSNVHVHNVCIMTTVCKVQYSVRIIQLYSFVVHCNLLSK